MPVPYSASKIARWFISWAVAEDADLSNLKLQKMLYYAQGWYLARNGTPLFSDEVQAWSHGPVVASVYHEFKCFGSGDVQLDPTDPFAWDDIDPETTNFLISVWHTYGQFAAWRLRNMTHEESPWKSHFQADERYITIPNKDMQKYFSALPNQI